MVTMRHIITICSCLLLLTSCGQSAMESAPVGPPVELPTTNSSVTTGPLQKQIIGRNISATGRIEIPPTDLFSVHARASGQVTDIRYIPGDFVRKGALLLRINNPGLLEKQRELLETRVRMQLAEKEFMRQQTLANGEATTAERLDAARGSLDLLRATYAGLSVELQQYGVDLELLEKDRKFQSSFGVYAPASAYVHEVGVNEGKMIVTTDELMELAGTKYKHLELQVPANQVARLREDQEVRFTLPYNGKTGTARIEKINPMIDDRTSTLQVHCKLVDEDTDQLLPGLFLNATIITDAAEAYALPQDAVVKEGSTFYAYRVVDKKYEKTRLLDVESGEGFVRFSNPPEGLWVTGGAYYLAGEE